MKRTDFGLLEAILVLVAHHTITIWANMAAAAWGVTLPDLPLFKQAYLLFALTLALLLWLKLRGETWESIGLKDLHLRHVGLGIALFVAVVLYSVIAQQALDQLIRDLTGAGPNKAAALFKAMEGNTALFLFLLPLTWLFAGFGEEVFYRGYLMTRFAQFMGETRSAWIIALFMQAALFGAAHWYQGPTGVVGTAIIGLFMGAATLMWGRNLWPAIIAHALIDTLGFTLLYLGLYGR
jgi:membrane protease YdiL (CAAX protease family)